MRRKLKNLKNKSGHSENGAPRQMIDEAFYRERQSGIPFDSEYGGWSWASRPRDQAITLRSRVGSRGPSGASGPTGSTGPTPPPTQFVDLGTAEDFAIFAEAGITNTGTSDVNGDMGIHPLNSTDITGFALVLDGTGVFSTSAQVDAGPPPQLGQVFAANYVAPTPAKVNQARLDKNTAYTDAIGRPPDVSQAGQDISLDTPLLAGLVHRYTSASTVMTPLTISGGAGDGIIIQVLGTLDIQDDILLVGGLLPENVYIVASGQITIFPGVTVNGEILGATGIAMQTGAILNGRALAGTAVTLDGNTINEV